MKKAAGILIALVGIGVFVYLFFFKKDEYETDSSLADQEQSELGEFEFAENGVSQVEEVAQGNFMAMNIEEKLSTINEPAPQTDLVLERPQHITQNFMF